MPQSDDERLVDLATRLQKEDPHFARSFSDGRPTPPREYRRTRAWWALGIGLTLLIAGMVLPDGLLIATGLVVSGISVHLLDPIDPHRQRHPRSRSPRSPRSPR
ncbi:DUF3040 domain-containing protein [Streptomyces viridosporus]|uniref:DUF3040 domain-containing protein n=1 Tax=Streptomyces viridosporus TaxID=67581 RepID=UPI00331C2D5C